MTTQQGKMRFFNERGFGFVQPDAGGSDIFVHVSDLKRAGILTLTEGDRIEFEAEVDEYSKGRPKATNIRLLDQSAAA